MSETTTSPAPAHVPVGPTDAPGRDRMLAIDARMARSSGIGTYIRETVPRLRDVLDRTTFSLLGNVDDLEAIGFDSLRQTTLRRCEAPIYSLREQWALCRACPSEADVFWSPHYNVPVFLRTRLVVTVHDLLHLVIPEYARGIHRRLYARTMFTAVARKAVRIFCPSRFTADELIRIIGVDARRIVVTSEGVDPRWFLPVSTCSPHPRPYFVYVGNVKPHKNLSRLCEAFGRLVDELPHDLLIVGRNDGFIVGGDRAVAEYAKRLGDRIRFTGEIPDERLRALVGHATALVLPSRYEGFGLPALEAMAAGCPALVSRAASLPEVCGGAAAYFDPNDPDEIAACMRRVALDPVYREELVAAGRERARGFTWEACARTMGEVLEAVLDAA